MQIIPAIDIIDGKSVRLTQGDYAQKKSIMKILHFLQMLKMYILELDIIEDKVEVQIEIN